MLRSRIVGRLVGQVFSRTHPKYSVSRFLYWRRHLSTTSSIRNVHQGIGGIFSNLHDGKEASAEPVMPDAEDILPPPHVMKELMGRDKALLAPDTIYAVTQRLLDALESASPTDVPNWEALNEEIMSLAQHDIKGLTVLAGILMKSSKDGLPAAMLLFRILANQGDKTSACNYAIMLYRGLPGVKADPIQAETILRTLVDQGHQAALLNLGTILIREHQDTKGAIELWEKAGKSGNPYGYLEIGKVYLAGRGVEKDPKLAFPYIEKAAHGNIPEAQFILGELLRHGYGPSQTAEREQGFQWIEKAAAKGFPDALYNVGVCYFTGDGVEKDERRALEFWEIAAEHDVPPALINLGKLYWEGRAGLSKDPEMARLLWTRASGHPGMFGEHAKLLLKMIEQSK